MELGAFNPPVPCATNVSMNAPVVPSNRNTLLLPRRGEPQRPDVAPTAARLATGPPLAKEAHTRAIWPFRWLPRAQQPEFRAPVRQREPQSLEVRMPGANLFLYFRDLAAASLDSCCHSQPLGLDLFERLAGGFEHHCLP
jgi:hypothetical protein